MPEAVLTDFLLANLTLTLLNIKQTAERNQQLIEEKALLAKKSNRYNPNVILETVRNNDRTTNYVFKGISRIEEGSYSEAMLNCYRVSEYLVKSMFVFLYPEDKDERMKIEDKLKRIWNDDEKEKHQHPGVKAIASLLSVILWYRNKMAAHTEMEPTEDAAAYFQYCKL